MEAQARSVFSGNVKFPVQHIWERDGENPNSAARGRCFHSRQAEKKKPSSAAFNLARYFLENPGEWSSVK